MALHLNLEECAIYDGLQLVCKLETYAGSRAGVAESWGARIVECCNYHDLMLALLMEASAPKRPKDLADRINAFLQLKVGA